MTTTTPDYIYDPDDWEATYPWDDRHDAVENIDLWYENIKRLATLVHGPNKWIVNIVLSWDDAGDPDETEIRWFDNEADAKQALADSLAGRPKV